MVRPTKTLGSEDWNGTDWQPYYKSVEEIGGFLEQTPVRYCILLNRRQQEAPAIRVYPHDALLEQAVAANPAQWHLLAEFPAAGGGSYRIFENLSWTPASEQKVYAEVNRIWMKYLP